MSGHIAQKCAQVHCISSSSLIVVLQDAETRQDELEAETRQVELEAEMRPVVRVVSQTLKRSGTIVTNMASNTLGTKMKLEMLPCLFQFLLAILQLLPDFTCVMVNKIP